MRVVIQRVKSSRLYIDQKLHSEISEGLLVLLGIEKNHNPKDIDWLCNKILSLRIFSNDNGKMDLSVKDIEGQVLLVSQFTLYGSTKKGNRPSFTQSEDPIKAEYTYQQCLDRLQELYPGKIESGLFGADMQISLENDGPVTLIIDTVLKE